MPISEPSHIIPPRSRGIGRYFFDEERRLGRIREGDPEILARTLLGGLHHYAFSEVTGLNRHLPMAASSFVRGLVDALWQGMAPTSEVSSAPERVLRTPGAHPSDRDGKPDAAY